LGTAATIGLLYQPRVIGDGDCGKIGGMKIGKGNRSTRRKPAPAPLCPPQIPPPVLQMRCSLSQSPIQAKILYATRSLSKLPDEAIRSLDNRLSVQLFIAYLAKLVT
jgi:hypothetical protein